MHVHETASNAVQVPVLTRCCVFWRPACVVTRIGSVLWQGCAALWLTSTCTLLRDLMWERMGQAPLTFVYEGNCNAFDMLFDCE